MKPERRGYPARPPNDPVTIAWVDPLWGRNIPWWKAPGFRLQRNETEMTAPDMTEEEFERVRAMFSEPAGAPIQIVRATWQSG